MIGACGRVPAALLAGLLCACASTDGLQPRPLENGAHLEWVPCWFEPSLAAEARCAHFYPSTDGTGTAVRLPVVVIKSPHIDARPSPVLYLPAGPGSATGLDPRGIRNWWHQVERARWPHDLVLFDLRGTGLSRPRLDCPEIVEADRTGLALPLTAADDLRRLQAAARECHRRLGAEGIELSDFSTSRHVRDIGELMTLLGGTDWNLWGVSYGTRLALHAVREYPERIRSVVLDSVYPPEVNGLMSRPGQFSRMLENSLAICAQDPGCAGDHPALGKQLADLMQRLSGKPVTLRVEKWPGLWRHELTVNDYRLLWMLFLENYRPPYHPRFPGAVAAALAGDYEPLLPLAELFIETLLDPDFSHAVYYAVVCAEDLPGVNREAYLAEARRHPAVATHLAPEWDLHVCHFWDVGSLPAKYRLPVRSDLPALFLNGVHDAVTLPQWAQDAAAGFRHGRRHTLPHSSHAVTLENDCAMAMVWDFLANPRDPPQTGCWREAGP